MTAVTQPAGTAQTATPAGSAQRAFARVALLVLAALQGTVAVWALAAPRSFYDDFPGAGRHWVSALPPYNEHLVRDVGALSLALTVLTIAAALWTERRLVLVTAAAWLAWSVPHVAYHAATADVYSTSDAVLNLVGLGLEVLLPVALILAARRLPAASSPPAAPPRAPPAAPR